MDNIDFYSYAVDYINAGIAVFPLKQKDKTPLTKNGVKDATTDPAQVKAWWQKYPNANIGIATGKPSGGLCAIDMDIDENKGINGFKSLRDWQSKHGIIKPSWMSKTGRGGYHYFFISNEPVKNRVNIIPAVDIRGDGGYVVAPPSIHPNGTPYQWMENLSPEEVELVEADDNIKFFLAQGTETVQTRYLAPSIVPEGERNHTLFRFACMMQSKGASDEAVYAATMAENNSKCNPPMTAHEVSIIVNSALKYEKGKPIYIHKDMSATQGQREPMFALSEKGRILKTWDNIREAIEYDSELYGNIRFNELANSIFVYGTLPWDDSGSCRTWNNSDDASLKSYLEKKYGFNSTEKIMDALLIVATNNKYNPIVDELNKIYVEYKDDCKGAIRKLLPEYMGCKDDEYNYEVMKVYMLGAISRAFYAGCKFDYTLILYGTQGFGKSEFLRHLAICSEWFNDNFGTFEGDKAIEKLAGMWIIELAELKALKTSKDAETFKAFLTSRVDTYRAPYSRRSEQRPRMCVFAGTTNNKNVFVDKTGNRRFLPIETRKGKQTKDLFSDNQEEVMLDFKKAWAEAMTIFKEKGEHPSLVLPNKIREIAEQMQNEFSEDDYRVGMIQSWLDSTNENKVCVPMIIEYALDLDISKVGKPQRKEIMEIMENEIKGWSRATGGDSGRLRFAKYGRQMAFIKDFS
ncbi:MAG: VapE family protein [Prevotellaceae bacterium]|nr:VapE family protein [Prevotellaceae bacterium]